MQFIKKYISAYRKLDLRCQKFLIFYMLQSITAGVGFFISIYLSINIGLSIDLIGKIVGSFVAGNLAGSWFVSKILDRVDPYKISSISLITQGLSFILICVTRSPIILAGSMFVMGASGYIYLICNDYLITNLAGKDSDNRALAISLLNVSSNIGIGLGGVIVSYLSKHHPLIMFGTMGVSLLIMSVIYFFESDEFINNIEENTIIKKSPFNFNFYLLSLSVIFLLGVIFAQHRVGYAIFLEEHFGESGASSIFLINSLLIVFSLPTVTRLANKYNQIFVMGLGGFLLGGGMFLLQYTHSFLFVIFICIISTFGEMLGGVFSQLICFQCSHENEKGKAMGYYKFLYSLGTIFGTIIGSRLQENLGINSVWNLCGISGLLVFLSCLYFYKPKHPVILTTG